ncbi:UNVERIFIED_CONTAM: hypothetical protein RMT77_016840 [Armadillidium vulgare]
MLTVMTSPTVSSTVSFFLIVFSLHMFGIATPSLEENNVKTMAFNPFEKDYSKSRQGKILPMNTNKFWIPLVENSLKNSFKKVLDPDRAKNYFQGRFLKYFSPTKVVVDPSQMLFASLSANIPKIGDAYVSIAESLNTISRSWKFEFSEVNMMKIIDALNVIAENCKGCCCCTPPCDAGG